jgi:hypothetical protein
MKKVGTAPDLYRILDANLNRSKEGLRVCEDICRYIWDDKNLTKSFKDLRHDLTNRLSQDKLLKALANRAIESDVGRKTTTSETKRRDLSAVFLANCQRVKESLRVLEEVIKLIDPKVADHYKKLRYRLYFLEQKSLKKS